MFSRENDIDIEYIENVWYTCSLAYCVISSVNIIVTLKTYIFNTAPLTMLKFIFWHLYYHEECVKSVSFQTGRIDLYIGVQIYPVFSDFTVLPFHFTYKHYCDLCYYNERKSTWTNVHISLQFMYQCIVWNCWILS